MTANIYNPKSSLNLLTFTSNPPHPLAFFIIAHDLQPLFLNSIPFILYKSSILFQHEVLVASDRVVLKLDDLASWVTEEVEWNHGIVAPCAPSKKVAEEAEKKAEVVKGEKPLNDSNNNTTTSSDQEQDSEKLVMDIKEEKEDIQGGSGLWKG